MSKRNLYFIVVSACLFFSFAAPSFSAPIIYQGDPPVWTLRTVSSVYQTAVASDGALIPVYYGPAGDFEGLHGAPIKINEKIGSNFKEVPYRGGFVNQTPQLDVVYRDGTRDAELVYEGYEILQIGGCDALRVDLKDSEYGLTVSQWYRVIPELDLIQKWMVLKNTSDNSILIENAQSGSIWLQADEYDFYHLSGRWGEECMPQKCRLTPGTKTLQVRDFRCYNNPPWFAVGEADSVSETQGRVWFGGIEWCGDWRLDVDKQSRGQVQVVGGVNHWDSNWTLKAGETYTTPRIVFGFANDGLGGVSHRMHSYCLEHLMRPSIREKLLPVLYNSWYATTFNIEEEQQLKLAEAAKKMGVELFCIDDGWFKGRKNDRAGLGDWTVDQEKFPNGLQPTIDKIEAMGMDFGIWVEPEMVNPDSDLYRAHPDWCFHYPKRTRHEWRNQLMLNLAREDVYQYLLDSLSSLLRDHTIEFIKWDYNRALSEPGWPDASPEIQREVRIRYFQNFQRLIGELEKQFPDVIFECCAGGGGRNNYGFLPYFDQFWASDNTDPPGRVFIQHGFLQAFPAKTMVSWITHEDWRKTHPSMKFRFHVSMCGVLGVGANISEWSEEQIEEAAGYIEEYKQIRPLVQHGVCHRLLSPFEDQRAALEYVSGDGEEAAVFLFHLWDTLPGSTEAQKEYRPVRLRGLDSEAEYIVTRDSKTQIATGKSLMNVGIPWNLWENTSSALVRLQKK